ncbi:endonuclease/exonuclease/phosphatase family protein [Actinoplanes sp. CA-030573]|uniref:endonuclease/exonuclease/phosphatase family protein n=1 Tax=Actinoplanes sp. CA-030573 TaxID=3239898 RepID=UPI003D8ACE64
MTVLRRERPDLLALQELRGWDRRHRERMRTVADATGMVPHLARSVFGQPVAVLVRPPLRIVRRRSFAWRMHHAAAAVRLSNGLTFVSAHLNPWSGERRRREAVWLSSLFPGEVIIAGDMNSLDPYTDHSAALAGIDARRHLLPSGEVDTRAIASFRHAGFSDWWCLSGVGEGRTVPTSIGGAEFGPMRLDYILARSSLVPRDVRVLCDEASDHYPVRADL